MKRLALGFLCALALPALAAAQPLPDGPEFQVNTTTEGSQLAPSVETDAAGNFVVVWTSRPGQDGSGSGVFGRRFDASGTPRGGEIPINQTTAGEQDSPRLSVDAGGDFAVVWRGYPATGGPSRIFGRRFDASGAPREGEFQVSGAVSTGDFSPDVALTDGGEMLVVWEASDNFESIFGRRYAPSGEPAGPEFRISPTRSQPRNRPVAAEGPAGELVVVWEAYRGDGSGRGDLSAVLFGADGTPGGEFRINSLPELFRPFNADVAFGPDGGFIVTWDDIREVYARRYGPTGEPLAPELRVNSTTEGRQELPSVAVDPGGGFTIVWSSRDEEFVGGIFGQRFDPSGAPRGPEFRLDAAVDTRPAGSGVAAGPEGDFVAVWAGSPRSGEGGDGDRTGVFGRRFRLPPLGADPCLFAAGRLSCDVLHDGGEAELVSDLAARPGEVALLGDLGGDSRDDLCFYRNGRFRCDTAHDGGRTDLAIVFGGSPVDVPLIGDLNGDGGDDACVYRRRRFACDTAGNGGSAELQVVFGRLRDIPLLGDVDGDGDDDPCVYRSGRFLCDTVHDGGSAEVTVSFGTPGGVPLLGDADDDGDDDFCLFRGDRFLCDTGHDGGAAEVEILSAGSAGLPLLGELNGF